MEGFALTQARVQGGQLQLLQGQEWLNADDVSLLAQGGGDSEGFAVVGEGFAFYVVNTQPDLQTVIDQLISLTDQIITIANMMVSRSPDQSPLAPDAATAAQQIKQTLEQLEIR